MGSRSASPPSVKAPSPLSSRSCSHFRMARVASKPFMIGMSQSMSTRSKSQRRPGIVALTTARTPSSPLNATATL